MERARSSLSSSDARRVRAVGSSSSTVSPEQAGLTTCSAATAGADGVRALSRPGAPRPSRDVQGQDGPPSPGPPPPARPPPPPRKLGGGPPTGEGAATA